MQGKVSPIFRLFHQQFEEAKQIHASLSKQFRSKKAIELEQKFIFLEIYLNLLSRIHFHEDKLKFQVFAPFNGIFKNLKKVKHLKLVLNQLIEVREKGSITYNSYEKHLEEQKKELFTEGFDLVVSSPLQIWEDLYQEVYKWSKGLKPLMINTAITQMINEELDFFNLDNQSTLDSKALKDIYEGLRVIIALENLRIESGFNTIFVTEVHSQMQHLQKSLHQWYQNQLFIQHLSFFLREKENIPKKYIDLLALLKSNKKRFTAKVEEQCKYLFDRILT